MNRQEKIQTIVSFQKQDLIDKCFTIEMLESASDAELDALVSKGSNCRFYVQNSKGMVLTNSSRWSKYATSARIFNTRKEAYDAIPLKAIAKIKVYC